MKVVGTIEARMGSTRLPGKILMEVCGVPILQHIVERLQRCKEIDQVVVATTTSKLDDPTEELCKKIGVDYFRGSEPDITERLVGAGKAFNATHLVQMTGDCPFLDWDITDKCIQLFKAGDYDYFSNRLRPTYPCGTEAQIFPLSVLERVQVETNDPEDREHGSYFIYNNPEKFKLGTFESNTLNCPEKRWVLDYPEDMDFTKAIYEELYPKKKDFDTYDILRLLEEKPELEKINSMHSVIVKNYI